MGWTDRAPQRSLWDWGAAGRRSTSHVPRSDSNVTTIGTDIGKNGLHLIGLDGR
jgi:hypothetical protein